MTMRPAGFRADAGFSLLEAVIVLAITSMLMLLIFSIGSKATQTGFSLGRRAMGLADLQLGLDTTRALMKSMIVPAPGGKPPPDFDGTPDSVTASASLLQATPCGGPGPLGLVRLSIRREQDGRRIVSCQTQTGSANLIDLGKSPAGFGYSTDGVTWSDAVHISGQVAPGAPPSPAGQQEKRVLVRLATADGRVQVSELLTSGPPGASAPAAQTAASGQAAAGQQAGGPQASPQTGSYD